MVKRVPLVLASLSLVRVGDDEAAAVTQLDSVREPPGLLRVAVAIYMRVGREQIIRRPR